MHIVRGLLPSASPQILLFDQTNGSKYDDESVVCLHWCPWMAWWLIQGCWHGRLLGGTAVKRSFLSITFNMHGSLKSFQTSASALDPKHLIWLGVVRAHSVVQHQQLQSIQSYGEIFLLIWIYPKADPSLMTLSNQVVLTSVEICTKKWRSPTDF